MDGSSSIGGRSGADRRSGAGFRRHRRAHGRRGIDELCRLPCGVETGPVLGPGLLDETEREPLDVAPGGDRGGLGPHLTDQPASGRAVHGRVLTLERAFGATRARVLRQAGHADDEVIVCLERGHVVEAQVEEQLVAVLALRAGDRSLRGRGVAGHARGADVRRYLVHERDGRERVELRGVRGGRLCERRCGETERSDRVGRSRSAVAGVPVVAWLRFLPRSLPPSGIISPASTHPVDCPSGRAGRLMRCVPRDRRSGDHPGLRSVNAERPSRRADMRESVRITRGMIRSQAAVRSATGSASAWPIASP